jgi:glutathione S-transferase
MGSTLPSITLYTAHHCPFAHRVQIALRELDLPFTTSLVDITKPRTQDYLAVNPTGQVPALNYNDHILTESALIAYFLAESQTGQHTLQPRGDDATKVALEKYELAFFVDKFMSTHRLFDEVLFTQAGQDAKHMKSNAYVESVVNSLEPLLVDAAPFFRGSRSLTMVEVGSNCSPWQDSCNMYLARH